jgi:hypothetical protein
VTDLDVQRRLLVDRMTRKANRVVGRHSAERQLGFRRCALLVELAVIMDSSLAGVETTTPLAGIGRRSDDVVCGPFGSNNLDHAVRRDLVSDVWEAPRALHAQLPDSAYRASVLFHAMVAWEAQAMGCEH